MTETSRTDDAHATGERRLVAVHAWIIALTTLVGVAVAALLVLSQPVVYQAEAEVEVAPVATRGAPIPPVMGTEREVALSGSVARAAAARMDAGVAAAREALSVSVVTDTDVMVLRFEAPTARRALTGVEAFTQSYAAARNAGQRERRVTVITQPELLPSTTPRSTPLLLAAGLLGGLGLGVALAFAWDRASGRVRSVAELAATGVPVLAADLPLPSGDDLPQAVRQGRAGYLAARVEALTGHGPGGTKILVTGAGPGGDTALVAALTAGAMAASGRRAVLVETDQRAWRRGAEGGSAGLGFSDLLVGRAGPEETAHGTGVPGLRVIGPGARPGATAYDGASVGTALDQLGSSQAVVLAGPPVGSGPVWSLATHVDLVVVVVHLPRLRRREAAELAAMLRAVDVAAVGWVVPARGRSGRSAENPSRSRPLLPRPRSGGRRSGLSGTTIGR